MRMKRISVLFLLFLLLSSCAGEVVTIDPQEPQVKKGNTRIEVSVDGKVIGEKNNHSDPEMFFSREHLSETITVSITNVGEYGAELHVDNKTLIGEGKIQGTINELLMPGEKITFRYDHRVNPEDAIPYGPVISTLMIYGNFDSKYIHIKGAKTDVPMMSVGYDNISGIVKSILIGSSLEQNDMIEFRNYRARKDNVITLSCRFPENADVCSLIDEVEIIDDSQNAFEFIDKTGSNVKIRFSPAAEGNYLTGIVFTVNTSDGKTYRLTCSLSIEVVEIDGRFMAYDEAFIELGKRGQILSITAGSNGHIYLYEMNEGRYNNNFSLTELDENDEFIEIKNGRTDISSNHVWDSWVYGDFFYLMGKSSNGYILIEKYDLQGDSLVQEEILTEVSDKDVYIGSTEAKLFFADKNKITSYDKKTDTWSHVSLPYNAITSFTYDEVNDIHNFVDGNKNEILFGKLTELDDLLNFRRARIMNRFEGHVRKYIRSAGKQYLINDRNEIYWYSLELKSWERVLLMDGNTEYIGHFNDKLYFHDKYDRLIKTYADGSEFPLVELRRNLDPNRYVNAICNGRLYVFSSLTDFSDPGKQHPTGYIRRIPLV